MPVTRSQTQGIPMETPSSISPSPIPMDVTSDIIDNEPTLSADNIIQWNFDGNQYLKDSEGFLYDTITGENIGYFDSGKIMDMVEDGVWVEHSNQTEITPKQEVDKNYTELDLLKIKVKQLEKELANKDAKIGEDIKELNGKNTHIQHLENIRQELIESRDHWASRYNELSEVGVDNVSAVLRESGAFEDLENVLTKEQLKLEVTRKEQVIVRKDAKATRLINIIREKNVEIGVLNTSLESFQNYCWMLSTNVSNLSDRVMEWQNYYNQPTNVSSCSDTTVNNTTSGIIFP